MSEAHLQLLVTTAIAGLAASGIGILLLNRRLRAERRRTKALKAESATKEANLVALRAENERLRPYGQVADADAKAKHLVEAAQAEARKIADELLTMVASSEKDIDNARSQAQQVIQQAINDANSIVKKAKRESAVESYAAKTEAQLLIETANRRAQKIVFDAENRAEELAGDALKALREADALSGTMAAIKNKIEGYGRDYLLPGVTLLDQLAENYDFSKASWDYRFIRDQVVQFIRSGKTGDCDYVEMQRREMAVRFVTDAFNGKEETVLARLRHDNYGRLLQEILDAFQLVNANGRPFRNARITQEYLDLRTEELRLGVVIHEMKVVDVAEQKRIKDQIREEQRAQREFQRAMREAAKEQETLARAQEKIRALYEAASEEQKAKYEVQLQELSTCLAEAEAKSQRALSMAQQTKTGHVYVISNIGTFGEDVFKIGMTRRLEPNDRIRELGDASVPFEFDVHAMIYTDDAPALERSLHKRFALQQMNKTNSRKEFFRIAIARIKENVELAGISNVHWTLTGQAKSYRETLALENLFQTNSGERLAWLERQGAIIDMSEDLADEEDEELVGEAISC